MMTFSLYAVDEIARVHLDRADFVDERVVVNRFGGDVHERNGSVSRAHVFGGSSIRVRSFLNCFSNSARVVYRIYEADSCRVRILRLWVSRPPSSR